MKGYIARRFIYMVILLILSSMVSFLVITLPPGDYLTSYIASLQAQGQDVGLDEELALRRQFGLDQPYHIQYFRWARRMLRGDLGRSFEFNRPVWDVIQPRLGMTILVAAVSLVFTYAMAIPIGIYSAVRQYSIGDYVFTVIGFAGVSIPNFLLALVVMVFAYRTFGASIGGLFSVEYADAPWTIDKVLDLIRHLPVPIIVIGLSGTAWLIRTMRATLLDELHKPYVQTARAKGLKEGKLLVKYPIRVALNPIASTIGWALPGLFSGQTIISIVLDLPTIGPILLRALMTEDMFLAASTLFITTALTLVGTLISDMLLVWLDPRIQYT